MYPCVDDAVAARIMKVSLNSCSSVVVEPSSSTDREVEVAITSTLSLRLTRLFMHGYVLVEEAAITKFPCSMVQNPAIRPLSVVCVPIPPTFKLVELALPSVAKLPVEPVVVALPPI